MFMLKFASILDMFGKRQSSMSGVYFLHSDYIFWSPFRKFFTIKQKGAPLFCTGKTE